MQEYSFVVTNINAHLLPRVKGRSFSPFQSVLLILILCYH